MDSYSVEVKPSARRELEALPNNMLARVIQKIEPLGHTPQGPQDAKN